MAVGTSNFPGSLDTVVELVEAANRAETSLDGVLAQSAITINVLDASAFSNSGIVSCGEEIISYSGKTSTSLTGCVRGFEGTSDVLHPNFSAVRQEITARSHQVLVSAILALQTKVGTGTTTVGLPSYAWFAS